MIRLKTSLQHLLKTLIRAYKPLLQLSRDKNTYINRVVNVTVITVVNGFVWKPSLAVVN